MLAAIRCVESAIHVTPSADLGLTSFEGLKLVWNLRLSRPLVDSAGPKR